jgi:predicted nucleic acid-binding protein
VYFDLCALKRPWDDPGQLRVRLEAEAVEGLLLLVRQGRLEFVRSVIQDAENETNPLRARRVAIEDTLSLYPPAPLDADRFDRLASRLRTAGMGPLDAAHVAAASLTADVFVTVDDRLLRRVERLRPGVRAANPLLLSAELHR